MEVSKNEKGLTLIEVLLSMLILSLIFLSIMKFFPQMTKINSQNIDKNLAVNVAKEVLINWQESSDVQRFITLNKDASIVSGFTSSDPNVSYNSSSFSYDATNYYFETTKDDYTVKIQIRRLSKTNSNLVRANSIFIQLLNKKGNIVATTFGFVQN